jgi:hypothetical protein
MTFPEYGIQVSRMCSYRWQAGVCGTGQFTRSGARRWMVRPVGGITQLIPGGKLRQCAAMGSACAQPASGSVYEGLATVDVRDLGVHSGSPAGVLDGQ